MSDTHTDGMAMLEACGYERDDVSSAKERWKSDGGKRVIRFSRRYGEWWARGATSTRDPLSFNTDEARAVAARLDELNGPCDERLSPWAQKAAADTRPEHPTCAESLSGYIGTKPGRRDDAVVRDDGRLFLSVSDAAMQLAQDCAAEFGSAAKRIVASCNGAPYAVLGHKYRWIEDVVK